MTNVQKLQLKMSQNRERLNELSNPDNELTEDMKTELNSIMAEMPDLEKRYRAAIQAEQETIEARNDPNGSGDSRLDDLRQRATVSEYFRQALSGQPLDGACAELNQELGIVATRGLGGGALMPIEQLGLRLRADTPNTTTTAADADSTVRRPILSRLFARGIMDAMGVRLDSVPTGLSEYPILTDSVSPEMVAEGTDVDTEVASFTSQVLKPKRLLSRYEFTFEAQATIPGLDAALSADLQTAMTSQMDAEVITGDGTGANVRGLDTAIKFSAITDPSAVVTFGDAIAFGLDAIDGLHASSEADISVLLGPETYRKVAALLATGTTDNAFDVLRRRGTTVITSRHVDEPDGTSHIQQGYVHAGRDMARGDSIGAVWPAMELIRDPYTKAGESKTVVTAVALWDCYTAFRLESYKGIKAKLET